MCRRGDRRQGRDFPASLELDPDIVQPRHKQTALVGRIGMRVFRERVHAAGFPPRQSGGMNPAGRRHHGGRFPGTDALPRIAAGDTALDEGP